MAAHVQSDMAKLRAICERHGVQELALFGSVVRDDFQDASDVDVLVRFCPGKRVGFLELMQIQDELSQAFGGRVVDLRTLREIHPRLRANVSADREVLYADSDCSAPNSYSQRLVRVMVDETITCR